MRLEKIKLAGFKSFVDPTVLELRSPLVAVVGPNGCGKSNIIDAIRWVMGESSAKNLRGESMSDVIFNGSSSRKPVGQASIELIFDNSDGSFGGEYARFNEISVRRQGTRDGQSAYFLNGTRCRRKDITDVFLGTGLGPRSYAIIEQGMISRVIEAKPEELRAFLEEAAGISLYRKRRQETENRMRHTRENLDRLNDVRQELEKQLERLKRQSEAAERYQQYKADYEQLEAQLSALRWKIFNEQLQEKAGMIRTYSLTLEEKQATRASLDLELENQRLQYTEKMDAWKIEQGQYYELGAEIARIEQSVQHHREREQNLNEDLAQIEQMYHQTDLQIKQDKARLAQLLEELAKLKPDALAAQDLLKKSEIIVQNAEEAMQRWNQEFEWFQNDADKPKRIAEVEKARIVQLERQSYEAKTRLEILKREQSEIDIVGIEQQLGALESDLLIEDKETQVVHATLHDLSIALTETRTTLAQQRTILDDKRGELQNLKGRLASLQALQQAALGKTNTRVTGWLETQGLSDYPRLGETLQVETGFECAVETVLGNALQALCVPDVESVAAFIVELSEGHLSFIDSTKTEVPSVASDPDLLIHKIKTNVPLDDLLTGIYVVDELSAALARQKSLKGGESVVTRSGIWLGKHWLKVYKGIEGQTGVLGREMELKDTQFALEALQNEMSVLEARFMEQQEKIKGLEDQREALHQSQQARAGILNELSAKMSADRTRLEHLRNRLAQLDSESTEQKLKLDLAQEEIALARLNVQKALDEMEGYAKKRILLQDERENLQTLVRKANQELSLAKEKVHGILLKEQTIFMQKQAVEEGLNRLLKQQQAIQERTQALQIQLEGLKEPEAAMKASLEALLTQRMAAEAVVNKTHAALEELEQALRVVEKQRNVVENELQEIRNVLEKLRMDWQAIEVRCQTIQEKFTAVGIVLEDTLKTIPADRDEITLAQELEQIAKRIERLGPINLAAIEEYQTESERKNYLDSQFQDLTEALETLENAIRKIDKETRARFKETFEKVNAQFQVLFPRLFGGGQAYLALTAEDLLEAGVTVMARPPGKRNSSIHLLSGGEKALTAVAMVFAIFQLNPAPFCLLDEVDAPLDDANVGRYCELVKQLSKTVQFIFITHNKLAMEMAHHLVGVTMKEPGVSRLVSVDLEEAAALVVNE